MFVCSLYNSICCLWWPVTGIYGLTYSLYHPEGLNEADETLGTLIRHHFLDTSHFAAQATSVVLFPSYRVLMSSDTCQFFVKGILFWESGNPGCTKFPLIPYLVPRKMSTFARITLRTFSFVSFFFSDRSNFCNPMEFEALFGYHVNLELVRAKTTPDSNLSSMSDSHSLRD